MAKRVGGGGGAVTRRSAVALGLTAGAASCATARDSGPPPYAGEVRFEHGVASGDPAATRVIIWTRVTAPAGDAVPVRWLVARDAALRRIVAEGISMADARRDHTVKVDVPNLQPGEVYYYAFQAGSARSSVGRTRTLPRGDAERLTLAVVSCSNYPFGFFNAYAEVARTPNLDLVLHLGDYIYEYGPTGYGGEAGAKLGRAHEPAKEITTLSDYRARHAQYKADPDLQAAHAAAPWLVTWDDHEVTNDSWRHGAENHDPSEGAWDDRKAAALQAYYEWMPIREPQAGRAFEAINRAFDWGGLATIVMLETRLLGRDQPLDWARDLKPIEAEIGGVARPVPFDVSGAEPRPITDPQRLAALDPNALPPGVAFLPDMNRFKRERLADPSRQLLGAAQEDWLAGVLARSKASGAAWRVLGNQVLMTKLTAPDVSGMPAPLVARLEQLSPGIGAFIQLTRFGPPLNLDAWDGYPAQRERVLRQLREAGGGIVVTGDTHAAWASELKPEAGGALAAVEFGTTSVTSPGLGDLLPGMDIGAALVQRNAELTWTDQVSRGWLVLTLTPETAEAEFFALSGVTSRDYVTRRAASFRVRRGDDGGVLALERLEA